MSSGVTKGIRYWKYTQRRCDSHYCVGCSRQWKHIIDCVNPERKDVKCPSCKGLTPEQQIPALVREQIGNLSKGPPTDISSET